MPSTEPGVLQRLMVSGDKDLSELCALYPNQVVACNAPGHAGIPYGRYKQQLERKRVAAQMTSRHLQLLHQKKAQSVELRHRHRMDTIGATLVDRVNGSHPTNDDALYVETSTIPKR
jgi:hypothetical protein